MAEITGLLLAAGRSRRFGSNKLLARYRQRPLVMHSASTLCPCDRVIAVVRKNDVALQQLLESEGIETLINTKAARGLGSSIGCGVNASLNSDGWCILPADMPDIPVEITRAVVAALRGGAPLAAPWHAGRRGHPAGFSRGYRQALQALDAARGARDILESNSGSIVRIECETAGIHRDIDTRQDLAILTRQPAG